MGHRRATRGARWAVIALILATIAPAASALGIGIQTGIPIGGFFSVRDWLTPVIGIEAIVYASEEAGELIGMVTGRLLSWSEGRFGDTYVAGGLTYAFPDGDPSVSAVVGIEFGVPYSQQIMWNLEIGISYQVSSGMSMAMGTGIHFYFNRP